MRRQAPAAHDDDVLGLAGWMYADLFLALMVIFLATISFVPALSHVSVVAPSSKKSTTTADYFKAMSRTYTNFSLTQVENDVYSFQRSEGLPEGTPVILSHLIGGYQSGKESTTDGNFRALVFSQKLSSAASGMFASMQTQIDSSTDLASNQVAVVFTFGPKSNL